MKTRRMEMNFFNQSHHLLPNQLNNEVKNELTIDIQLCCHTRTVWYSLKSAEKTIRSHHLSLSEETIEKMFLNIYKMFSSTEHLKSFFNCDSEFFVLRIIGEDLMPLYAKREKISNGTKYFNEAMEILQVIEHKSRSKMSCMSC